MRLMLACTLLPALALAHAGVDGATKVRMDLMKAVAAETKALGKIAKSGGFDATAVARHARALSGHAAGVRAAFAERHMHPKTEALPAVWDQPERFGAIADEMGAAAAAIAAAADRTAFVAAFDTLAATCKACHKDFRQKKH